MKSFTVVHDEIRNAVSDEICFADEIKSVFSPDEVGFHHEVISSHGSGIYPVEDGFSCTNEKKDLPQQVFSLQI